MLQNTYETYSYSLWVNVKKLRERLKSSVKSEIWVALGIEVRIFRFVRSEIWVALGIENRVFRFVRSEIWVALGIEDRVFSSV